MLTQYRLLLEPDKPCRPRPEWGYPLYAELLSLAPPAFGELSHRQGISPLSQYLFSEREGLVWGRTRTRRLTRFWPEKKSTSCAGSGCGCACGIASVFA